MGIAGSFHKRPTGTSAAAANPARKARIVAEPARSIITEKKQR